MVLGLLSGAMLGRWIDAQAQSWIHRIHPVFVALAVLAIGETVSQRIVKMSRNSYRFRRYSDVRLFALGCCCHILFLCTIPTLLLVLKGWLWCLGGAALVLFLLGKLAQAVAQVRLPEGPRR
jgi:hypothetical protein